MALGEVFLATSHSAVNLYLACVVIGISDGIMWSLGPLLTGKAFGLVSAGRNFGFIVLAAAAFTIILSFGLEPTVYQAHVPDGQTACKGHGCFGATFWTAAALGIAGAGAALFLHRAMQPEPEKPHAELALMKVERSDSRSQESPESSKSLLLKSAEETPQ